MIIQNIKINNKDFILTIDNKTYLIDEYLYKIVLPYPNKFINENILNKIKAFANLHDELAKLYKKIFNNDITKKNLIYILKDKNYDPNDIKLVIETLINDNYLSDEAFIAKNQKKFEKKFGKNYFKMFLERENIDKEIIEKALLNYHENVEYINEYITIKYRLNKTSLKHFKNKICLDLLNKGFDKKIILDTLNKYDFHENLDNLAEIVKKYQKKYSNDKIVISKLLNKGYNVDDIKMFIRKSEDNE